MHPPLILRFIRHGLPALVVITGIIFIVLGSAEDVLGGAALVGAGVAIWLLSWFYRSSINSNRDREREESARRYFDEHGHWPQS
jgi:hypothetical protein